MSRAKNVPSGNFSRNLKRKVKHWCMAIMRHKRRWIIQRRSQRPPSWRRILTKIVHVVHWRYKTIIHVYKLHSEVRMKRGVVDISHGGLGTWVTREKRFKIILSRRCDLFEKGDMDTNICNSLQQKRFVLLSIVWICRLS